MPGVEELGEDADRDTAQQPARRDSAKAQAVRRKVIRDSGGERAEQGRAEQRVRRALDGIEVAQLCALEEEDHPKDLKETSTGKKPSALLSRGPDR